MNERSLKLILSIIPIIIIASCILAAFAANGWNIQNTVVSEEPAKAVEVLLPFELGNEMEFIEFSKFRQSEDNKKITIEATVHSPFKDPLTIEEFAIEINARNSISILELTDIVEIPPDEYAVIKLESQGTLIEGEDPTIRSIRMKMNGIELEINEDPGDFFNA